MADLAERVGSSAVGERVQRIVATAVELAEQGGFENVRLREVAASSGVALGTLYRHFRSKEDLLLAALSQEVAALEARMAQRQADGSTPLERVTAFFRISTRAFCRRPNLARAVLRAVASGDAGLTEKVARFHDNMSGMITAALRGEGPAGDDDEAVADALQGVWFAALVGWAGGLHGQAMVVDKLAGAARLLLRE